MIEIIPAIDIIAGECVRLTKGDYSSVKTYYNNPLEVAKSYEDMGIKRLHIVDLDGAKSSMPQNLKVVEGICSNTKLQVQFGGGIKSDDSLSSVFAAGVEYAIIGSIAVGSPELFKNWLSQYRGRMILGADIKGREVAINGWLEGGNTSIYNLVDGFLECGLERMICTDIDKDGMLEGPNFELYKELQGLYPSLEITVSGGISKFEDIEKLNKLDLHSVIVGKAIYEGRITDKEIMRWLQNE